MLLPGHQPSLLVLSISSIVVVVVVLCCCVVEMVAAVLCQQGVGEAWACNDRHRQNVARKSVR